MKKFNSPFGDLTIININGVEYFVGIEVCAILEYTTPHKAIVAHVNINYKTMLTDPDIITKAGFDIRRTHSLTLITEQGLYALAMKSKMPKALEFQDWVYNLLQKIRKGEYGQELQKELHEHIAPMFQTPEEFYPKNDYRAYGANMVNQFLQNNYNSNGTSVMINDRGQLEQVITDSSKVDYSAMCFQSDPKMIMLAFKLAFGIELSYLYTCMKLQGMIKDPTEIISELTPDVYMYLESVRNYTILNTISSGFNLEIIQIAADTNNFNSPYNLIKEPNKEIFKNPDWNKFLAKIVTNTINYYSDSTLKD